jgi:hypothetical protein
MKQRQLREAVRKSAMQVVAALLERKYAGAKMTWRERDAVDKLNRISNQEHYLIALLEVHSELKGNAPASPSDTSPLPTGKGTALHFESQSASLIY